MGKNCCTFYEEWDGEMICLMGRKHPPKIILKNFCLPGNEDDCPVCKHIVEKYKEKNKGKTRR